LDFAGIHKESLAITNLYSDLKNLWITKGIKKTWTVVYNPRANRIDERFKQTLMNMITSEEITDWEEFIWEFYFYNVAINASTEESPFFLQFLRNDYQLISETTTKSKMKSL
jgi:hypothetical protein